MAKEFFIEKAKELLEAPTCCKELKEAARNWLDAVGTENEAEAAKAFVAELEEDVAPIDGLIGFAGSDFAKQMMGAEKAEKLLAHALEAKANGAKYCDCPACAVGAAILEAKDELLN